MKTKIVIIVMLLIAMGGGTAFGLDCRSSQVIRETVSERDKKLDQLLQAWCTGQPFDRESAAATAVVYTNETYLCVMCRKDPEYLAENLVVLDNVGIKPGVKTLPSIVIEHLYGADVFTPALLRQAPQSKEDPTW